MRIFCCSIALASCAVVAMPALLVAQDAPKPPVLSPRDTIQAEVGGAKISIDYSRPSKRDRVIFGKLVPHGKVWRTGANAATTLTIDKSVMIGNSEIPAGKYTLYTIPDTSSWVLIVNKQTGQWGTQYNSTYDLVRIPMSVGKLDASVETFEISMDSNGVLHLKWDTVDATVPVTEKK